MTLTEQARRRGAGQARTGTRQTTGGQPAPRRGQRKAEAGAAGRSSAGRTAAPPVPPRVRSEGRGLRMSSPDRRARGLVLVIMVLVSLFAARLVQMQGLDATALAEEALGNRLVKAPLLAHRGQISDREGVALASSVERRNITVDQTLVASYQTADGGPGGLDGAAADIAAVTGSTTAEVRAALDGDRRFAYVVKGVTPQVWRAVQDLRVPGVYSEKTSARSYPAGAVAGNLIGFTGGDEAKGLAGLEMSLDEQLAGKDGERHYERGGDGQMIPTGDMAEVPAVDGRDVRLTIDRDLQWYAQQAIAAQVAASGAQWGNVFAMEVETGNILALAESPSVDPNNPGASKAEDRGTRALSDVIEPGSTAKVITAAAAIEEGVVTPESQFVVPDRYTTSNGQTFRDSHPHPKEKLTFAGILGESSNTGTVMVGQQLSRETRYEYLKRFGLGQPSGLDFPGQTNGILAPADSWDGRQQFTVLFGQGVSVNALQSAQVFATIANDGVRMTPRLVDAVEDEHGTMVPTPASEGTTVVSPETAQQVRSMLEGAVSEGTGGNATVPGYRVAGKTGTAQAPLAGGYSGYTGSFIGMAPAEDPKIVIGVTLQRPTNGYYGGTVAAPVFRDVMSFALQDMAIPPSGQKASLYPLTYE